MGNILFGLELNATGGPQSVGEFKKLRQAMADTKKEAKGTGDAIGKGNANLGGGILNLVAKYYLVAQAIQGLIAVAKPAYDALIGQNAQLQQQLIGTQSTLAATNEVFKDGVRIGDPTEAIKALEGPVNEAIAKIRKGSLELVGVTSKDLVEAFQIVAGKSGEIGIGLNQAADLTLSFSAALGTLGIPLVQARQEIQSILTGTIDQNSVLAQSLGLKNEEVRQLKEQGKLYETLTTKLSAFRAGNKLSAQTIGGITSNIQELFDEITRQAGQPLLDPLVKGLDEVFQFLNKNKDAILAFVTEGVDGFLSFTESVGTAASEIGDNLKPVVTELAQVFDSDFGLALENVVNGLLKFAIRASDLLLDNPAVRLFLKVADAAVQAAAAITSLNGDFGRSVDATEIYRQQSAKVAQEAVDALKGGAAARKEAIAKIDDQIKILNDANVTGSENRAVIRGQINELELYKQKLESGSGAIKLISKDTKEQTKALEEQAKAQGDALKAQREAEKNSAQEQFDAASRDRTDKAAQADRDRQEQFDAIQRAADERYQELKRTREEQFQAKQKQIEERFQDGLQAKQESFQFSQNQEQERFQERLQKKQLDFEEQARQRQERTATAFTDASRTASQAEQLAAAQTADEREKLTAEFRRQARIRKEISQLSLADQDFNPTQILDLAKKVSRANLSTVEGAKTVQDTISAIQAEQQKQQAESDRVTRLAFEKALQEERKGFELAQQTAAKEFQTQQQEERKAFELAQQQSAKDFQSQEREIDKAYQDLQRQINKTIADYERATQRAFEDENRAIQKAFAQEQRELDKANAEEIQKLLASVKTPTPAPRRMGGDVDAGQPYLVGEAGPELIFPNRSGFVATARETAAMMAIPSLGNLAQPNTVVIRDSKNAKLIQELIQQTRTSNAHLAAIASRRPVETLNKTTINNEYNTRSSRGLPR